MKKGQQGFEHIAILIVVAAAVLIGAVGWLVYNRQHNSKQATLNQQETPTSVESAADTFLISKVGNDNFKKYYIFDKSRTSYANPKDSKYDFIAYHFSPVKAVTDYDDVIMVQINRNDLREIYADTVPDCVKNASFCNFNIDKQKAEQIARQNSLTANDLGISWGPSVNNKQAKGLGFVVVASSCSQNKSLFIDYRDGSVLWTEAGCGATD